MSNKLATVFLVDDDPVVRKALPRGLQKRGYVVEAFDSAQSFLDAYAPERAGCLILDLSMPGMDGLELQQDLITRGITIPIIFITGHGGVPESVQAMRAGAIDFLEKPFLPNVLAKRVEEALIKDMQTRHEFKALADIRERFERLTDREKEICQLLLDSEANLSSKEIARALDISHRTVEQHRSRVLEKTQAKSTSDLLSLATRIGLISSRFN